MRFIGKLILVVCLLVVFTTAAYAREYPKATGFVNDFANLLSKEEGASLNDELAAFEKRTTMEFVVVTVMSLDGETVENYTTNLANAWGVGKPGQNSGIMLLIAQKERKMRIATAVGARKIFTDSCADKIRDEAILPSLKVNNWSKGIIDGAHAIMQFIDVAPRPVVEAEAFPTDSSLNRIGNPLIGAPVETHHLGPWTIGICVSAVVIAFFGYFFFSIRYGIRSARTYVMENKGPFAEKLAEVEVMLENADIYADVKEENRKKLADLRHDFSSIDSLSTDAFGADWVDACDKLHSFENLLHAIFFKVQEAIDYVEKARREGPELMKNLPSMIEEAKKKLAEGKQSRNATRNLKIAGARFRQALRTQSEMVSGTNWLILYAILSNVQDDVSRAESAHEVANTDYSAAGLSSSNDESSSTSFGFGGSDSGGLSGGGGFDSGSGGGGSSGDF